MERLTKKTTGRFQYSELEDAQEPKSLEEWHEDIGAVLWWRFPIEEPPYCGTPLDFDWIEDYYTHWTPIVEPIEPK